MNFSRLAISFRGLRLELIRERVLKLGQIVDEDAAVVHAHPPPTRLFASAGPALPHSYTKSGFALLEHRVHDRPRRFDGILSREQRRIALHGVADEALVRVEAARRRVLHDRQLDRLAEHAVSGPLRARANRQCSPAATT